MPKKQILLALLLTVGNLISCSSSSSSTNPNNGADAQIDLYFIPNNCPSQVPTCVTACDSSATMVPAVCMGEVWVCPASSVNNLACQPASDASHENHPLDGSRLLHQDSQANHSGDAHQPVEAALHQDAAVQLADGPQVDSSFRSDASSRDGASVDGPPGSCHSSSDCQNNPHGNFCIFPNTPLCGTCMVGMSTCSKDSDCSGGQICAPA